MVTAASKCKTTKAASWLGARRTLAGGRVCICMSQQGLGVYGSVFRCCFPFQNFREMSDESGAQGGSHEAVLQSLDRYIAVVSRAQLPGSGHQRFVARAATTPQSPHTGSSTCHFTIAAISAETIVSVLHKITLNVHASSAHLSTCQFMTVATSTRVSIKVLVRR